VAVGVNQAETGVVSDEALLVGFDLLDRLKDRANVAALDTWANLPGLLQKRSGDGIPSYAVPAVKCDRDGAVGVSSSCRNCLENSLDGLCGAESNAISPFGRY